MNGHVRVNLIVEGQSEETFVRDSLSSYLGLRGVYVTARCVETSRKGTRIFRGGLSDYAKPRKDIQLWLRQDSTAFVSTMFDLYGLPSDFPGHAAAMREADPFSKVRRLEQELQNDIGNRRFVPYFQLHEFEALLFADPETVDSSLSVFSGSKLTHLRSIRNQFASPEHIDDGENTAPSKRLKQLYPDYDKPASSPRILNQIGVETLRRECLHFSEWIARLEALINAP